ncbi:MAG TPA: sterol desaturase family protein [Phnomibacter sp.]|nr:sterol desaturase family protein [Phnomibacter sp.]
MPESFSYFDIYTKISMRYVVLAGIAFLVFYVWLYPRLKQRKIQQRLPTQKDVWREVGYSVVTMAIFALNPFIILGTPAIRQHTLFYTSIAQYGWVYFVGAFFVMLFLHDTYFYWMHRLMHHPRLFKWVHLVHHKSNNPSPWAAYAFHPLEAIIESGIVPLFLFIMPIHPAHLAIFFLFMITYNVYGHLGWELYPKGFSRHWLGRWINTSVNHNQHHQYYTGNYGLYFLFWDRWMGTIRKDYEQRYEQLWQKEAAHS